MLTCAHAPCYPCGCGEESEDIPRFSEVLHHQNNCCLWKGQVSDPGYPLVGVTNNIVLPTRSRKALCLSPIKGLIGSRKTWSFSCSDGRSQYFSEMVALPKDEKKNLVSYSSPAALEIKPWANDNNTSVFAVDVQKFILHDSHERGERVGVTWPFPTSYKTLKM